MRYLRETGENAETVDKQPGRSLADDILKVSSNLFGVQLQYGRFSKSSQSRNQGFFDMLWNEGDSVWPEEENESRFIKVTRGAKINLPDPFSSNGKIEWLAPDSSNFAALYAAAAELCSAMLCKRVF